MGDGQIQYVLEHEIKAIQSCMAKAGLPDDQVKLTYIIGAWFASLCFLIIMVVFGALEMNKVT